MSNAANLVGQWVGGGGRGGNSGWGCLAVHVFQANAGSMPRVVGSLCRSGWGLIAVGGGSAL